MIRFCIYHTSASCRHHPCNQFPSSNPPWSRLLLALGTRLCQPSPSLCPLTFPPLQALLNKCMSFVCTLPVHSPNKQETTKCCRMLRSLRLEIWRSHDLLNNEIWPYEWKLKLLLLLNWTIHRFASCAEFLVSGTHENVFALVSASFRDRLREMFGWWSWRRWRRQPSEMWWRLAFPSFLTEIASPLRCNLALIATIAYWIFRLSLEALRRCSWAIWTAESFDCRVSVGLACRCETVWSGICHLSMVAWVVAWIVVT